MKTRPPVLWTVLLAACLGSTFQITAANYQYQTDLISMNLTGDGSLIRNPGEPSETIIPFQFGLMESPTMPSFGTFQFINTSGNDYQVESFFDVFPEISLDGGSTWHPRGQSIHLVGASTPFTWDFSGGLPSHLPPIGYVGDINPSWNLMKDIDGDSIQEILKFEAIRMTLFPAFSGSGSTSIPIGDAAISGTINPPFTIQLIPPPGQPPIIIGPLHATPETLPRGFTAASLGLLLLAGAMARARQTGLAA